MKHATTLRKCTAAAMSCALVFSWLSVPSAAQVHKLPLTAAAADETLQLPERYDPRQEAPEILTPVKTQTTPICWAYSTLGCIETCLIKQGLADNSLRLAASHLIWFSRGQDTPTDPEDPRYGGGINLGDEAYHTGSYALTTAACLASWQGVIPECQALPITQTPEIDESQRYWSAAHMQNSLIYAPSEKDAIKESILRNGALIFDYFQVEGNILSKKAGYYNAGATYTDAVNHKYEGGFHAVAVVGWDDNYSKTNFTEEAPGDGAWIVKNSYGNYPNSENGYFYMSYYEPTLAEFTSFEMEPVTNYGSVHNYNSSALDQLYFSEKDSGLMIANVFEAKEPETVTAIGFFAGFSKQNCIISVYALNPDAADPTDGTRVIAFNQTVQHKGFHTIKLPESYRAEAGQKYSVVIRLPISTMQTSFFDNFCCKKGVSYYCFYTANSEGEWKDCYNARRGDTTIHVYTEYEGEEKDPFIYNHEGTWIQAFPEPLMQEIYTRLDENHDGYITSAEIMTIYKGIVYDISDDGFVDSRDVTLLKRAILGLQESGSLYNWHDADLNLNSHFDSEDVEILLSFTLTRPRKLNTET